jgi:ABC-type Na+ transport system ATPase subunit NatA
MFGLLGPNGAGKSSLMRTIATLQTPTAGEIKFGDIDVLAEPERLRKTLGYLPQDFGVYPRVSAYAMLDQLAVMKGITRKPDRKAVVETLLNQTNLWAVRDKTLAGFSGGMRQRFGVGKHVDVAKLDASRRRLREGRHRPHQRRFAGAVGPQKAEHPARDRQAHVVERDCAVGISVR